MIDPYDCENPDHEGTGIRGDHETPCDQCLMEQEDAADEWYADLLADRELWD